MTAHLTDQQLIDHGFRLLDGADAEHAAQHLVQCPECRARLDALMRRFAVLDELKDAEPAPEALIAATIAARRDVKPSVIRFPSRNMLATLLAVAASAILAVTVWWPNKPVPPVGPPVVTTGSKPESPTASAVAMVPPKDGEMAEDLLAKPPFAPASKIELNVLPRRDHVQLTIYNEADLTLVREQRNLTLKRGWNWLQFMWANTKIDPTSLSLEPMEQRDKIDVQELDYPPGLKDLGRWLIASKTKGSVPFELCNFSSGISWEATYHATLAQDEKTMRLNGFVRVRNNSGEDYDNAQVRLVVGKLHVIEPVAVLAGRPYAYGRPGMMDVGLRRDAGLAGEKDRFADDFAVVDKKEEVQKLYQAKAKEVMKEGLSEYFLYTIEGRETLLNGWAKRLSSFDIAGITVTNMYKYDEERWGTSVMRFISTANDKVHNLGQTPIPNGRVVINRSLAEQHLTYEGQSTIKYIPVGEEMELALGAVRNVTVEPKLMNFRTGDFDFDHYDNITGWTEQRRWMIEVKNTRDLPVFLEITRGLGTTKWSLGETSGAPCVKHDTSHIRFTLTLPPACATNLMYEVTSRHGTKP